MDESTPPTRSDTANSTRDRSTRTDSGTSETSAITTAGAVSSSDRQFILEAAKQGRAEMQLSQLAATRGSDPQVRQLAQQVSNDHQRSHAELEQLAARKGINLNADVRSSNVTQKLSGEKGADFDKQYAERIAEAHENSVELYEKATRSDDAEVAAFASRQLPTLQAHHSISKQLDKSLN